MVTPMKETTMTINTMSNTVGMAIANSLGKKKRLITCELSTKGCGQTSEKGGRERKHCKKVVLVEGVVAVVVVAAVVVVIVMVVMVVE